MKTVSVEKKLVDKLVEQSTETIDEVKIAEITVTENIRKCSSCPLYIVLFLISLQSTLKLLLIFFYYKYMNHNKKLLQHMIMSIKQEIININGKYQTK